MADDVDVANEKNELYLEIAQRNRAACAPVIMATGRCLYCDEPALNGNRWCGVECRDAWQREQKRR